MQCTLTYQTRGSDAATGTDRGRVLGSMDSELAQICLPESADKSDYTQSPAVALGSKIFWSAPVFADAEFDSQVIRRKATVTVYFIPEGA
jgi:hypothetical protein